MPQLTHCATCGYCLNKLPSNRCPECGEPFDPNQHVRLTWRAWCLKRVWRRFIPLGCRLLLGELLACAASRSLDGSLRSVGGITLFPLLEWHWDGYLSSSGAVLMLSSVSTTAAHVIHPHPATAARSMLGPILWLGYGGTRP